MRITELTNKILKIIKNRTCVRGRGCKLDFRFFSLLYGTPENISRKPATGGMASQHLRTLERGVAQKKRNILGFLRLTHCSEEQFL